jgi:regulator of protease activity HflC (stomatin/prohibitin superfamily)
MPSDISQVSVNLDGVRFWSHAVGLVLACALLYATRRRGGGLVPSVRGLVGACAIVFVAYGWIEGFGRVQPGARGVVLRFGAPTGRVAGEGLYVVIPFVERVVSVNTQINTIHFDRAQATSHDLEPVYANLDVTFHVVPNRAIDVYRRLRANYAARIVRPAVQDAWKETVSRYVASDLIDKRDDVQKDLREAVVRRIEPFGLSLDAVSTMRFNFAYAYAQAAQLKVASVQRTLQAQQELARVKIESQQGVIRARSEVEALKLQNKIPIQQLIKIRQLDLERRAIDKWDGHLPQSTTTMPFLGGTLGGQRPD